MIVIYRLLVVYTRYISVISLGVSRLESSKVVLKKMTLLSPLLECNLLVKLFGLLLSFCHLSGKEGVGHIIGFAAAAVDRMEKHVYRQYPSWFFFLFDSIGLFFSCPSWMMDG